VRPHESSDLFDVSYRDDVVACRGPVDEACAREAARRAELPVAWLPDTDRRKTRAFVVWRRDDTPMPLRPGSVFQHGRIGWVRFELSTNPGAPGPGGPGRTIDVGGTPASLRVDGSNGMSFVSLDWTVDGVAYRLAAFRLTEATEAVTAEAERMVRSVRYARPGTDASG
jgi:hypothetical protein